MSKLSSILTSAVLSSCLIALVNIYLITPGSVSFLISLIVGTAIIIFVFSAVPLLTSSAGHNLQGQIIRQESILGEMKDGLLVVDKNGLVSQINKEAGRLLELSEKRAKHSSLEHAMEEHPALLEAIKSLEETQESKELEILKANGTKTYLQISKTTLPDSSLIIVLTDISRLKSLEKIRQDFVANVSHELKTPVTSIMGFVETLQDGAMENKDEAKRFLGIIERQSRRLTAIIEDLLMLARLEGTEQADEMLKEKTLVKPVLGRAISFCELKAGESEIGITVNCDEQLSYAADWSLLEQAIVNLIDNAVKYSGEKTKVEVSAFSRGEFLSISVKDEGPGIPEKSRARLFERFYRVDKARSRNMGGTGLGLAIVKHVANFHGGNVEVYSELGKGSEFVIVLPLGE